jgi:hypothetical protein
MGTDGATCFHTLTTDQRDIPKDQWDTERFGMVCTQTINFADWKAALEKLCHMTKSCDYETKQKAEAFFERVEKLQVTQTSRSTKAIH